MLHAAGSFSLANSMSQSLPGLIGSPAIDSWRSGDPSSIGATGAARSTIGDPAAPAADRQKTAGASITPQPVFSKSLNPRSSRHFGTVVPIRETAVLAVEEACPAATNHRAGITRPTPNITTPP